MLLSTLLGSPSTSMAAACMLRESVPSLACWIAYRDDACCGPADALDILGKQQTSSKRMHPASVQLAGTRCHTTTTWPVVQAHAFWISQKERSHGTSWWTLHRLHGLQGLYSPAGAPDAVLQSLQCSMNPLLSQYCRGCPMLLSRWGAWWSACSVEAVGRQPAMYDTSQCAAVMFSLHLNVMLRSRGAPTASGLILRRAGRRVM